jgi:hypothetical protein
MDAPTWVRLDPSEEILIMLTRFARASRFVITLLVLVLLPLASLSAQGWRDRIKKIASDASGLTAARAILAARPTASRGPSALAGTYRVTFTVAGGDSVVLYARTFVRPTSGLLSLQSNEVQNGYLLPAVTALSLSQLPTRAEDTRQFGDSLASAPLMVVEYAAGPDSTQAHDVSLAWLALPTPAQMGTTSRETVEMVRSALSEGKLLSATGDEQEGNAAELGRKAANTRVSSAGRVVSEYRLRRNRTVVSVRSERVSDTGYSAEGQ